MEKMDEKSILIAKIRSLEAESADDRAPVVSLEDFFEGNSDQGSIGCNLIPHLGTAYFFHQLLEIRDHPMVQTVLVEIYEVDETLETWPFSERVYVYTALPEDEISRMMSPLNFDELEFGFFMGKPASAVNPGNGMNVYAFWWD